MYMDYMLPAALCSENDPDPLHDKFQNTPLTYIYLLLHFLQCIKFEKLLIKLIRSRKNTFNILYYFKKVSQYIIHRLALCEFNFTIRTIRAVMPLKYLFNLAA